MKMTRYSFSTVAFAAALLATGCNDATPVTVPQSDAQAPTPDASDMAEDTSADLEDAETPVDVPAQDVALDVTEEDAPADTEPDTEDEEVSEDVFDVTAEITFPGDQTGTQLGDTLAFEGVVRSELVDLSGLTVVWRSDQDGSIPSTFDPDSGVTRAPTDALTQGVHTVRLIVQDTEGRATSSTIRVQICANLIEVDFDEDLNLDEWALYGNAYRDERGWLEMTDNAMSRKGLIYHYAQIIGPGSLDLSFKVSAGQCRNIGNCFNSDGADGFAMSIFDATTLEDLEAILAFTGGGGNLGYGLVAGAPETFGFHVEFDTYYNSIPPHPHQDPTREDHVAVHFNGKLDTDLDPDPMSEVSLWAAMPNLEDNFWHDVDVKISGNNIRVDIDGQQVIDGSVPAYQFKGGMIGFSGSTGAVTNFHRFDELVVREVCWPTP